jgi:hypothetical protein
MGDFRYIVEWADNDREIHGKVVDDDAETLATFIRVNASDMEMCRFIRTTEEAIVRLVWEDLKWEDWK